MVLISSTSALGNRGQANYSAAKAGIQGLAKTLAIELGPFGDHGQLRRAGLHRDGHDGADGRPARRAPSTTSRRRSPRQMPLQRVGQPDDVAGVIAFLCSDDAAYVSGQVIYVRGGP